MNNRVNFTCGRQGKVPSKTCIRRLGHYSFTFSGGHAGPHPILRAASDGSNIEQSKEVAEREPVEELGALEYLPELKFQPQAEPTLTPLAKFFRRLELDIAVHRKMWFSYFQFIIMFLVLKVRKRKDTKGIVRSTRRIVQLDWPQCGNFELKLVHLCSQLTLFFL